MKLWLLERLDSGGGYDEVYGFVVRAETAEKARRVIVDTPTAGGDEGPETWLDPQRTSCEELTAEGESQVILENFRAG